MKKTFKKFLSLLLICSIMFTTNSFTTFADAFNNEETESYVGVSSRAHIDEENTEGQRMDELSESESTEYAEEPEFDETTTEDETITEEETTENNVGANSVSPEEEITETTEPEETTETTEETLVEVVDTSITETVAQVTLGDGDNHKFTFKMQDGFGWYNSEDGDTTIEYDSSDDIVIPVVYPVAGPSAGYIWIDYGWAKDEGGHSGPMMTENQLQELINTWKTNPTEDITIYPNFEHFNEGNIKTPPSKLNYAVGQDIDPTGIVFALTKGDIKKEVPYALPQYERLYSREILNAAKESLGWDTVTADTKYCRFHFDDMIYQDVELTVNVPHTFTFFTNELYPEDFGYFDAAHTINKIEYKSEELDTKPIEIPLVYIMQDSGAGVWLDVGWLLYKGEHEPEEWLSDKQLETLVNNWTKNPNEDVRVRVSFNTIYHSSVKKNPNRTTYHIGEEIDPTGLVIEVSDEIFDPPTWTKDVAYDAVQYKDLFSRELLNADKGSIGWDIVTADTKYCRFHFASGGVYEDVELEILKAVSEISLVKEQNWKEYSAGEKFDPKGLVIHVKYDDGEEADVAYEDKRVLFLFDPYTLPAGTSQVNVLFGGKTTTTPVTIVDNVYALYYYNSGSNTNDTYYVRTGEESNVESALDNAISLGATGFYKISASGYYDGYKKYNKNSKRTLTRDEALDVYKNEYDGNSSIYIGASFYTSPSPGGGGSSGGSDGPVGGPIGGHSNNTIPDTNNIPQSNLVVNMPLAFNLLSYPTNANRSVSKVVDRNGNEGFGRWLQVPNTTEWYFLSGELSADGSKGTFGFITSGFYNLSWGGIDSWYYFNEDGSMRVGWYQENGNTYFLQNDFSDGMYGRVLTGIQTIEGRTYNFGNNGILIN